jgi:hypothetical protein
MVEKKCNDIIRENQVLKQELDKYNTKKITHELKAYFDGRI